jgi:hypothetical protein
MMVVRDLDTVFIYPAENGAINALAESTLVT